MVHKIQEPDTNLEHVPCPLCGNLNPRKVTDKGQHGITCNVVICPNDGLVYLTPRWTKEAYSAFYQTEFDKFRPKTFEHVDDNSRFKNAKVINRRLEKYRCFRNKTSILDIGAGSGDTLEWLKINHPSLQRYAAIEFSEQSLQKIREKPYIELLSEDFDSPWHRTPFDIIILRHVLEHFLNPIDALKKIKQCVPAGSYIYIAVPDMMDPRGKLEEFWFRWVHTFYFSEQTLMRICALTELTPVAVGRENSEVWGIFTPRGGSKITNEFVNPYNQQIELIDKILSSQRKKSLNFS